MPPAVIAGLAVAVSAYSASKQVSGAKKQEKQQKSQLELQRRVDQIKARRAARIKSAQFLAQTAGAGVSGDFVTGTRAGIESELKGGIELSNQQYALQNQQLQTQTQTATQGAFFDLGQAVISAGSQAYAQGAFLETPSTTVTDANRPGGTGTPFYFLPAKD